MCTPLIRAALGLLWGCSGAALGFKQKGLRGMLTDFIDLRGNRE